MNFKKSLLSYTYLLLLGLGFLGSLAWLYFDRSWEPLIVSLTTFAALIGYFLYSGKEPNEEDTSANIDSGPSPTEVSKNVHVEYKDDATHVGDNNF